MKSQLWKRRWCWQRLRAGGEGEDRRWDGWMASPTQWTWVWVGSRNWCWTGRPGVLQLMGLQRVGHDWVTELNWWLFWGEIFINSRCRGIAGLFKILKDDVVKVLHSVCQQIQKIQSWPQDCKRSVFIPVPKKGNDKECSNYHTIALISHASKKCSKPSKLG